MENTIKQERRIRPKISQLNKYVQRVQKVAISAIDPVYCDNRLEALNIHFEGPPKYLSYLGRLIDNDVNLKVS